jgi:hypothetical protein
MAKRKGAKPRSAKEILILAAREFGKLGGKARAKKLSEEERREIARKAVQARWAKARDRRKAKPKRTE